MMRPWTSLTTSSLQMTAQLLDDEVFLSTLHSGTFSEGGFIPAHKHWRNCPGHNWTEESERPAEPLELSQGIGAWKCMAAHSWGDYYVVEERASCPGCGFGRDKPKDPGEREQWTVPYVRSNKQTKNNGYVLFRKATDWKPDDYSSKGPGAAKMNGHHNLLAASLCELLQAQYPTLTVEDRKPYWSRPVKFASRTDISRLKNLARSHRDL
ncbi:hypothetical protein E8E11_007516 [Didymella keratinophila]|nr:hypothetical protein E8E11_007516 [Didymella keratinophila]